MRRCQDNIREQSSGKYKVPKARTSFPGTGAEGRVWGLMGLRDVTECYNQGRP